MSRKTLRPVRERAGVELPIPGRWELDPGHAEIGFWGRHFMITRVRGRFTDVSATIDIADRPEDTTVEATIVMSSVESGDETRDEHLRSADFFDVRNRKTSTFRSTRIEWDGVGGTMEGDLTIRGISRPVTLEVQFDGALQDPWGNDRAVFEAWGTINREDWGLTWNQTLESGGLLVSKDIHLELNVELVRVSGR